MQLSVQDVNAFHRDRDCRLSVFLTPGEKDPEMFSAPSVCWRCTSSRVRLWARRKPRPTAGGPQAETLCSREAACRQQQPGPAPRGPAQPQAARAAPAARLRAGAAPCWPPAGSGARLPATRGLARRLPQPGAARRAGRLWSCWGR